MSKLLRQGQNTDRALQIRIEEASRGNYLVILAGITPYLRSNAACEETDILISPLTYHTIPLKDFDRAEVAYESLKKRYLD